MVFHERTEIRLSRAILKTADTSFMLTSLIVRKFRNYVLSRL